VDYGSLSYPDAVGCGGGIFHGSVVVGFQLLEYELVGFEEFGWLCVGFGSIFFGDLICDGWCSVGDCGESSGEIGGGYTYCIDREWKLVPVFVLLN
jgi:hypothetical protein